ncbi:hypothetical protein [Bacillus sp. WP8]|nr:hypothetical protein [Bacillus sp. WP8]
MEKKGEGKRDEKDGEVGERLVYSMEVGNGVEDRLIEEVVICDNLGEGL